MLTLLVVTKPRHCPRCGGRSLLIDYEALFCILCGWRRELKRVEKGCKQNEKEPDGSGRAKKQ